MGKSLKDFAGKVIYCNFEDIPAPNIFIGATLYVIDQGNRRLYSNGTAWIEDTSNGATPDLSELISRIFAVETVNNTQTAAINAINDSINSITISIGNVITSVNVLATRINAVETVNATQTNDLNNLLQALLTGITVIDNKVNYPPVEATPATVSTVSNASATEGSNVVHTVTLNKATPYSQTFSFVVNSGTATAGDYILPPTFSNGVTILGNTITVPSGVTSFTVSIATSQDATVETNETYTLVVGGVSGTGTINNDDSAPPATVSTIAANTVTEGGTLVFTVTLNAASIGQSFTFSTSGTAAGADISTASYSNGVTVSGGNMTVPLGVTTFTISVPIVDDSLVESSETLIYTIGGISGTGTINDNDASGGVAITTPTVTKSGSLITVTFTTSTALRAGVEFGLTTAYGTAVVEDFGSSATSHSITLESNTDPLLSPHGLQTGLTYNLRAVAGVGGTIVSSNITFVA